MFDGRHFGNFGVFKSVMMKLKKKEKEKEEKRRQKEKK